MFEALLAGVVKVLFFSEEEAKASGLAYNAIEGNPDFIDIYHPVAGWKALHMSWEEFEFGGGAYTPWDTDFVAFDKAMTAYHAAFSWAEAIEVHLRWHSELSLQQMVDHVEERDGLKATLNRLLNK